MDDRDLDKLLSELPEPPNPSVEARKRALKSAMEEFERHKEQEVTAPSKGIAGLLRLMGEAAKKLLSFGGSVMTRPAFVNSAIGLFVVIILGVLVTPALRPPGQIGLNKADAPSMPAGGPVTGAETPRKAVEKIVKQKAAAQEERRSINEKAKARRQAAEEVRENHAAERAETLPMADALVEAEMDMLAEEPVPSMAAPAPQRLEKKELRARSQNPAVMGFRGGGIVAMEAAAPSDYTGRPMPQEYVGRDKFEAFEPNPVKLVSEAPVSTFSIDVDTASYAFVRRALNSGYIPQKDSIRLEEMINYFDYTYDVPDDKQKPFKPTVAVYPSPWNNGRKLLHIGIKGHEAKRYAKPRSNLVFLLDVSGSMDQPDKLPLLKNSMRMLVENLDADDSVAMVVYAGAAGTVLEPTKVEHKGKILAALDKLSAGGSTAGGEGIRLAYALAEQNFEAGAVNRVILATDGDFNVGIREPGALQSFIEKQRDKGIYLSVLGFGQGNYNDALMQRLAQNGNGNAAYIDSLNEARKVLVDEAGSTLFTIAKDVKIQVEFNPALVSEYRLIGYETRMLRREDFNNDKVDAGEVGSGATVTAIYEITPVGSKARHVDDLRYGKDIPKEDKSGELAFLRIRYKLPKEDKSRLIERAIGDKDGYASVEKAPGEMRFAASVAAFGQVLRGGTHTGEFGYDEIIKLARPATGDDEFGYRTEFLNLVRLAKSARSMGER